MGAMTYKDKNRWVFHPDPNANGFEELDVYFREMGTRAMEALMVRGYFAYD